MKLVRLESVEFDGSKHAAYINPDTITGILEFSSTPGCCSVIHNGGSSLLVTGTADEIYAALDTEKEPSNA